MPVTSALQCGWSGRDLVTWWWDGRVDLSKASASGPTSRLYSELVAQWGAVPPGGMGLRVRVALPGDPVIVAGIAIPPSAWSALRRTTTRRGPPSASVAWCGQVVELAERLLARGHVFPELVAEPSRLWTAKWHAVRTEELTERIAALTARQPPAVRALAPLDGGGPPSDPRAFTEAVLDWTVDHLARSALRTTRWTAPLKGVRGREATAARAMSSALVRADSVVAALKPDAELALTGVADALHLLRTRALGQPVLAARLRLGLPDDEGEDWPLTIEVYDRSDASRWCTADDVWAVTPLALDLAGAERHLPLLDAAVRQAAARVHGDPFLGPFVAPWADAPAPSRLVLDVVGASTLLERVTELEDLGLPLHVPGQLLPVTTKVRGAARPAAQEGDGRLGAKSLVAWSMVVDEHQISDATLERAVAAGASLLKVDGKWVRLDATAARKALKELAKHRREHAEVDPATLMRLAAEAAEHDGGELVASDTDEESAEVASSWVRALLSGLPDAALREGHEPPGFEATLRPYQRRGLGWLQFLAELGLGGCLADDMGLGKTPTTLAHLVARPGPHLVVCPLSVVRNWQSEAARFTPLLRVLVHHGNDRLRGPALERAVAQHDLVISTYGLVARDAQELAHIPWSTLVLDEAQAVKNAHTKAAKAVRRIPAAQKLALTGTPVENRLGELWAILDVVVPGLLGSETKFRDRWATPIERQQDLEVAARLRTLTGPFVLRRTKADKSLVPDLPDKVEQIAWAPLTKEQGAMYQAVVDELLSAAERADGMQRRGLVLAALTRLKQICNHPAHALRDGSRLAGRSGKLARFDELVTDLLEAEERALVFTQYREMGELLQRHLQEQFELAVPFLHGGVPKAKRDRMVDHFQAGEGAPLLLVSLKAGGTGLNLTAASRVVHYDRWWNPAVEDQATDRAWRIGQQRSVFVHKLVCQGTLEERIAQLIDDKRKLAGMVIGGGEAWLSELSTDQLRDLVTLDNGAYG